MMKGYSRSQVMTKRKIAPYMEVYNALREKADATGEEWQPLQSYSELSKHFGFSISTVVRAINMLKEEGYVQGEQGRVTYIRKRPKITRRRQIAFVTPALGSDTNSYVQGLSETIDSERFTLATYSTHSDLMKYQSMIEEVAILKPSGVVLTTLPEEICEINPQPLIDADIPVVIIGPQIKGLVCDRVFQTGRDSGRKLTKHLLENGYDDFALLIGEPYADPHKHELVESVKKELKSAGKELSEKNIFITDDRSGYMAPFDPYVDFENKVKEILSKKINFRTLICGHDYPAVGALRAILSAGLRVPEDIAVASAMRCAVNGSSPLKLTSIDTRRDEQARLAAEILIRRIDGFDGPPETHYVSGEFQKGETT